jgi:putative ABC transport system permease protein
MTENLALAFQGVWSHKLRSVLTMLGIIIGIASIITIVSTIRGTNEQIKNNLVGAGTNSVVVQLYQDDNAYDFMYSAVPDGVNVITEDTRQELLGIDNVESVSLCCARSYVDGVFYKNAAYNGALYGVDQYYFDTCGYSLDYGRNFTEEDFSKYRNVVILDTTACSSIFAGQYPVGKTLEIQGVPFTVIGVVEKASSSEVEIDSISDYYMYANTSSGTIFVPIDTWPVLYRFDEPQEAVLRADSTDEMTTVGQRAADVLTKEQIASSGSNFSYRSEDLMKQAEQLQEISNSTNRQLLWIASISLLVGGIGVMNIMLVTVTERTQEIGLKKAIGARRRRILWQFLTEAAVLTSLGGVLGVIGGVIMAKLISSVMGTPTAISVPSILVAVAFSTVIGIVFGLLPAVKASKLNPIDALRRE